MPQTTIILGRYIFFWDGIEIGPTDEGGTFCIDREPTYLDCWTEFQMSYDYGYIFSQNIQKCDIAQLILRPIDSADTARDIIIWQAFLCGLMEDVITCPRESFFTVKFRAMVDKDDQGNARLARVGDSEIRL